MLFISLWYISFLTIESTALQGMAHEVAAALHHDPHLQVIIHYALVALETPLHVALIQGHVEPAAEILEQNPSLVYEPSRSGSYPLHVASARGYEDIVEKLLNIDPSLCLLHDKEGRTPLHLAAMNGRTGVLELLHPVYTKQLNFHKSLARNATDGGEPILHLCMKHNQFAAAEFLIKKEQEYMKTKDYDGNTVLHLAAAREDTQMLEFLLGKNKTKDDLNVRNKNGFTALDVLVQNSSHNKKISEMIEKKGGERNKFRGKWRHFMRNSWDDWYMKDQVWTNEMHNTLMLVATLIVTVTFQAAINPPGGVWQELETSNSTSPAPSPSPSLLAASNSTNNQAYGFFMHASSTAQPPHYEPGTAIHNNVNLHGFKIFMYFDMIAFAASLSIILSLVSGFPLKRRFTTWVLVISIWAALSSMAMAFVFGTEIIIATENVLEKIPYIVGSLLAVMVVILLCHCVILVFRLRDKIKHSWACMVNNKRGGDD